MKRDLKASAQAFQAEGKVSSDPVGELLNKNQYFSMKEVDFICVIVIIIIIIISVSFVSCACAFS